MPADNAMVADKTEADAQVNDELGQKSSEKRIDERQELGRRGEDYACSYLRQKGMKILERNWRCSAGEADIIVRDGNELAFVEVKTRRGISCGFPEEAVTRDKRRRYEMIAAEYLFEHCSESTAVRFDVVAIILNGNNQAFMKYHCDAFCSGD